MTAIEQKSLPSGPLVVKEAAAGGSRIRFDSSNWLLLSKCLALCLTTRYTCISGSIVDTWGLYTSHDKVCILINYYFGSWGHVHQALLDIQDTIYRAKWTFPLVIYTIRFCINNKKGKFKPLLWAGPEFANRHGYSVENTIQYTDPKYNLRGLVVRPATTLV